MPFSNATQPQLEELLASLRTVEQRLQRVAQGSYPAPLDPTPRLELANLSTRLADALRALEVIGDAGVTLGPNDIIIDKTLPVPVRDQDTSVTGTGHVSMSGGLPLVGFTGEDVALVKAGTTLGVYNQEQLELVDGTVDMQGVGPRVRLGSNHYIVERTRPVYLGTVSGSSDVPCEVTALYRGLVKVLLPDSHRVVRMQSNTLTVQRENHAPVFGSPVSGININLTAVSLPNDCVVIRNNETHTDAEGNLWTFTVVGGNVSGKLGSVRSAG